MSEFSKSELKQLRELAGRAHAAELSTHLRELHAEFAKWERGELDPFDLNRKIHEFHQGANHDVYGCYRSLSPKLLVARAIAQDVLPESEVGEDLVRKLQFRISDLRCDFAAQPTSETDEEEDDREP
jgi:hypothetical protein